VGLTTPHRKKFLLLLNVSKRLGPGLIIWHDLSNGMGVKLGLSLWGRNKDRGVFENRVLGRIFGPKKEEDGSWKKLHNDELHSLYSSG
jgi:hypothetical protein